MGMRQYSQLTHTDEDGRARMVDVGHKEETSRSARAAATVCVGAEIAKLISVNGLKKGDVLSIAQLAGVMAAKKTSHLIPLCHNIVLDHVAVEATLEGKFLKYTCKWRKWIERYWERDETLLGEMTLRKNTVP